MLDAVGLGLVASNLYASGRGWSKLIMLMALEALAPLARPALLPLARSGVCELTEVTMPMAPLPVMVVVADAKGEVDGAKGEEVDGAEVTTGSVREAAAGFGPRPPVGELILKTTNVTFLLFPFLVIDLPCTWSRFRRSR
jgi:hypothetical protein